LLHSFASTEDALCLEHSRNESLSTPPDIRLFTWILTVLHEYGLIQYVALALTWYASRIVVTKPSIMDAAQIKCWSDQGYNRRVQYSGTFGGHRTKPWDRTTSNSPATTVGVDMEVFENYLSTMSEYWYSLVGSREEVTGRLSYRYPYIQRVAPSLISSPLIRQVMHTWMWMKSNKSMRMKWDENVHDIERASERWNGMSD
jgi:hypothetical protein